MRTLRFLIFTLCIVVIPTCCPDCYDDDDPIESGFKLLGTKTIGSQGGTVSFDQVTIEIPYGAFSSNQTIEVYKNTLTDNNPLVDYCLSEPYLIKGFPKQIGAVSTISFPIDGAYEGEPLIAFGFLQYSSSLDSTIYAYRYHQAEIINGNLVCPISFDETEVKSGLNLKFGPAAFKAIPLKKTERKKSTFFDVGYPKGTSAEDIERVESYLDGALAKYDSLGFNTSGRTVPMKVSIMPLTFMGCYSSQFAKSPPSDADIISEIDKACIQINVDLLKDQAELKNTINHELMHFVQNLYEFSSPDVQPEQIWLEEATAVWAEGLFVADKDYLSSSVIGNEHSPTLGWQSTSDERGYGMSFIFKEIEELYGVEGIIHIFDKIKAGTLPGGGVDPVDAIDQVLELGIDFFWHSTFTSYYVGKYYGGIVRDKIIMDARFYRPQLSFDKVEAGAQVSDKYLMPNLSGCFINVNFKNPEFQQDFQLSVTNDLPEKIGFMAVSVDLKKKPYSRFVAYHSPGDTDPFIIEGIKDIYQEGRTIVLVTSNSSFEGNYDLINEVEIKVSLESQDSNTLTDSRDGNVYPIIQIGTQTWMAQSLRFETPNSWYNYHNSSEILGRLYTFNDAKTACPAGWHLPSDGEWKILETFLGLPANELDETGWRGGSVKIGEKLKATTGWAESLNGGPGTNSSGFDALAAGYGNNQGNSVIAGEYAIFFSSSTNADNDPMHRNLSYKNHSLARYFFVNDGRDGLENTASVRCVKN